MRERRRPSNRRYRRSEAGKQQFVDDYVEANRQWHRAELWAHYVGVFTTPASQVFLAVMCVAAFAREQYVLSGTFGTLVAGQWLSPIVESLVGGARKSRETRVRD